MSFDQNMIIDATRGSIARFVNHSCEPNCKMVKWMVGGTPRMALFAGEKPIMTGAELTYDYNFDPFSAKNVQSCRCGSSICRGVLGPRPKDQPKLVKEKEAKAREEKRAFTRAASPAPKKSLVDVLSRGKVGEIVKAGKRKLQELLGQEHSDSDEEEPQPAPKKRKIAASKAKPESMAGRAMALKRSMSNQLLSARAAVSSSRSGSIDKKSVPRKPKTYGRQSTLGSRNSSMTLVRPESDSEDDMVKKGDDVDKHGIQEKEKGKARRKSVSTNAASVRKNVVRSVKGSRSTLVGKAAKNASKTTIRVITAAGDE